VPGLGCPVLGCSPSCWGVCAAIAIVTAATASADHHGGDDGHGNHDGSVTGFPKTIATVRSERLQDRHGLFTGVNTGNTFEQDYTDTGCDGIRDRPARVWAAAISCARTPRCRSVTTELFVTWFLPDGSSPDVFLMNFKTGIVSDVAPPGPQLSSVREDHPVRRPAAPVGRLAGRSCGVPALSLGRHGRRPRGR